MFKKYRGRQFQLVFLIECIAELRQGNRIKSILDELGIGINIFDFNLE